MTALYTPGALVRARDREWVVLPDSTDDLLMLRPLGGLDEEILGLSPAIEPVAAATFSPPDPDRSGDHNACRLLRDAARISTRAAAGPFRSFARIAVEPRPYQLVPLLMAMRLDPVRMLIADDVGIGKTIESCLVARELLDRGEASRLAVLCPPHLAEQWQKEMREKFHIEAELVLSSTVGRLERDCRHGESLFDRTPYVIISTDFIKSERRRDDFLRSCPELVIVDEAHTCTISGQPGKARQDRFDLIRKIAADSTRHMVLVTATPHSGNEGAFRSLLSLLDPKFATLPPDLESDARTALRAELASHLVQRRRGDIDEYLGKTSFPTRKDTEETYNLSPPYKALLSKVLQFANELVHDKSGSARHRRVRWWSALALLRAMASSPAAAAATLHNRAAAAAAQDPQEADDLGRRTVLDQEDTDAVESIDFTPGSDVTDESELSSIKDRLRSYAREAQKLIGEGDAKLQKLIGLVKGLLDEGYTPIVFCRFIDTAEYVATQLREALKKTEVVAVTGLLAPMEREARIAVLAGSEHERRVLVCTDCLSEGINLQEHFNAVVHYDLAWNPTRHEQREGRVDRFGQPKESIKVITYFGRDNPIDGIVLDVLLRKHKKIKSDLGISVAVPGSSEDVIEAIFEGLVLRDKSGTAESFLPGFEEYFRPQKEELHAKWDTAKEKEQRSRSRSRFAQHSIKTEEVAAELAAVRDAIGTGPTVRRFVHDVLYLSGVPATEKRGEQIQVELSNSTPRALRNAIGRDKSFTGRFDLPVDEGVVHLARTHPIVEGLASYVLETALDEVLLDSGKPIARRCGAVRTDAVKTRTILVLARFRHHLLVRHRAGDEGSPRPLLAEEIRTLAFSGSPAAPQWLGEEETEPLLEAPTTGNLPDSLRRDQLRSLIHALGDLRPHIEKLAQARAQALLDAHTRVRRSAKMTGRVTVEPVLPVDILGCFILIP